MKRLLAPALAVLSLSSGAHAQFPPFGQPAQPTQPPRTQPAQPGAAGPPGAPMQPNRTEQNLRRAEQVDSGRGLEWFFIGAEGSFFWLKSDAFSKSGGPLLVGNREASGVAPGGSIFLGGRFYVLTVGARVRTAWLPDSQFLSAGGEFGLRIPKGNLEPHLSLGGGYATLLGIGEKVRGFNVALGGGVDYYLSQYFSVGGLVSVELVSLGRAAYQGSPKGSHLGLATVGSAVLGLHF